ncbi:MAG: alpha/beta fold hydrolase [Solobacterium sp.]|nr:alpha/beta fold hydrolase [Solobacterium sp.]
MLHEITFPSFNQRDNVYGWIYVPASEPKGIIQLIHGFGEHSRRYLHMIATFVEDGYIVAADDHVGHGKTALENNVWGDWGDKGFTTMVEDEKRLHDLVVEKYPDLPYFMYGHSMGSFITRMYMTRFGDDLDGVVLCGTTGEWPNLNDNIAFVKQFAETDPTGSNPDIGGTLMGWMFARCPEGVKLGNEWICDDEYVQYDHANDPFDAFSKPTSNRSWLYFLQMMEDITGPEWAKKVPTDLLVFNIAGDQDPVGQFGEGIYQVSNWLMNEGCDVITKLYPGYRHEIHNYTELKDMVEFDILEFLDICL